MSKSEEAIQIRRLPGVPVDTSLFCVHPDGKTAFIFDICTRPPGFVEINLTDGKTRRYKTEVSKPLSGDAWSQIRAIVRESQTIILASTIEQSTKKCFLVLFSLSDEKISVIHDHYLGIVRSENLQLIPTNNETDDLYFFSHACPNECQTVFDIVKINVDRDGNITSQIVLRRHSIDDHWKHPFILSDAINFIGLYVGKNERLLTIPFLSKNAVEIKFANDNESWPNAAEGIRWISPCVIDNRVFYYLYNVRMRKGFLVYCDWNNRCWKEVDFDVKDHMIIDWWSLDRSECDGRLYLRGTCSLESCAELSHIYIFDVKNIFKKEVRDTVKLQVRDQGSPRPDAQGAIEVPNSGVSSIIAKLNQSQPWNPKSNTLSSADQRVRKQGPKVAPKPNLSSSKSRPAQNQLNHMSGKLMEGQMGYQSVAGMHTNLQWSPEAYEQGEKLGKGGFGTVFKCWDEERRRHFVAKKTTMKPDSVSSSLNEIKRLKDLSHPRIVEFYGFKEEDDGIVIFMEFMPQGSIGDSIRKHGAVKEKTAIIYISQTLEGLVYLHDRVIVHCDLKCDNLLSDHKGDIKIGDFGLSVQKYINEKNESSINRKTDNQGGGTAFWTDPELFLGADVSRKSDIWSLGCTLVEMLTKEPPYFTKLNQNPSALMINLGGKLLSYAPDELVPNASEQMQEFIGCLLQLNSANRPADASKATEKFTHCFK